MLDDRLSVLAKGVLVVLLAQKSNILDLAALANGDAKKMSELRPAVEELARLGYLFSINSFDEWQLSDTASMIEIETPRQVAEAAFGHIQETEEYLSEVFGPSDDGPSPREVADEYRQRYASAVEREGK